MAGTRLIQTVQKRLDYIDIARALALFAVIFGHTAVRFVPQSAAAMLGFSFVSSFHMPLFFIVSGFFMHLDKAFQLKEEVRRLIVPYLATAVTTIFLIGLSLITFKDAPAEASIRQILLGWVNAAIYGAGDKMKDTLWPQTERIGAIWFLLALFWSHLIVHQAAQTGHGSILVLAAFIIGYLSAPKVFLPFSIQPGLCASLYVYIGAVTWLHFPRIFKKLVKPAFGSF